MKVFVAVCSCALVCSCVSRADDAIDRIDQALTWSSHSGAARARLSGIIDLEEYLVPQPPPGVIDAEGNALFSPRLSMFLDGQWGAHVYGFAQARLDRGFDPSADPLRVRLDEYAVRWSSGSVGKFDVQAGKFATVVGNWAARHDSWSNAFITAPLPYENLTGLWDNEPPHSSRQLLVWSHIRPGLAATIASSEKYLRIPIIWGPSYTTGVAIAGAVERFRYAVEIKNASLSSRPDAWSPRESKWDHPTVSSRLRYVPDEQWEFGWSFSAGSFLRPVAGPLLAPSIGRGRYQEVVLGQDITYAWHHVQFWAEAYAARFQVPFVGNADTFAYYLEARYKFTPQLFGALRWNQQLYGTIRDRGANVPWGHDTWRIDVAPTYRLTPHAQLKLQYSVQRGDQDALRLTQLLAAQATLRF